MGRTRRWYWLVGAICSALLCATGKRASAQSDPDTSPTPPPGWLTEPPADATSASAEEEETFDRPWQLLPIPIRHPKTFDAPTARILPAAVLYSGTGIDTAGSLSGITLFGLGDVADFGVETGEHIRAREQASATAEPILPYLTAQLRMGVDEDRLFRHQPAVALGFRKSFERETDGHKTRIAELFLVASKRLGSRAEMHLGVSLWDAYLAPVNGGEVLFLHDGRLRSQIRPIFGIEVKAKPRAYVMVETFWAPEFQYEEQKVDLTAKFAFGVRYELARWAHLASGVSVPDIEQRDLLEAQIFTKLVFINHRLAKPYQQVK